MIIIILIATNIITYNIAAKPSSSNDGMEHSMDMMLSRLHSADMQNFDRVFLEDMIVHHQGAIDMARVALMHSNDTRVKDMSNDIIDVQTKEIDQMRTWLSSYN